MAPSSAVPAGDPMGHGVFAGTSGQSHTQRSTLIDFDELTGSGNPRFGRFDSNGYRFESGHAHIILNPTICLAGGCVGDGTPYLSEEAGGVGRPITMARADGGKFCLKQFDGAESYLSDRKARRDGYPNARAILVIGVRVNGTEVSQRFPLDGEKDGDGGIGDFQTFTLSPRFRGLLSVTFYGNDRHNSGAMSFDNVSVRA
jgi:hypothetical protein